MEFSEEKREKLLESSNTSILNRNYSLFSDGLTMPGTFSANSLKSVDLILNPLEYLANESTRFISSLEGHLNFVTDMVLTKDEDYIISCSNDLTIKGWSLSRKKEVFNLTGHTHSVIAICLSYDNSYVITGSRDKSIKVWNLHKKCELFTLKGHTDDVTSVAITLDGRYIVSGSSDKQIKIWDFYTQLEIASFEAHTKEIKSIKLTNKNDYIISCSDDKLIKVWNINTTILEFILSDHTNCVNCLEIGEGNIIVSGSNDKTVKVWDFNSRTLIFTLKGHLKEVYSVAISSNSKYIFSGALDYLIKVWDFEKQCELYTLQGHTSRINRLQVLSSDNVIISASNDRTIKIWNLDEKKEDFVLNMKLSTVKNIKYIPNSQSIAGLSSNNAILVWDCKNESLSNTLTEKNLKTTCFCLTQKYIIAGYSSGEIIYWGLDKGELILRKQIHNQPITNIVASANSLKIGSSQNSLIYISNAGELEVTNVIKGFSGQITAMCFNHDGSYIIGASSDSMLIAWRIRSGDFFYFEGQTKDITNVISSLDGKFIISGTSNSIRIWNFLKRIEEITLDSHTAKINTLVLIPSLNYFASGSDDGTVKIWDLRNFKIVCGIPSNSGKVNSITVYGNNESFLAVASDNEFIKFWRIKKRECDILLQGSNSMISSMAISKDSGFLVGCFFNKTIKIWDLRTYNEIHVFQKAHEQNINAILLTLDDNFVISASDDKLIKVWDIKGQMMLFQIEHHISCVNCLVLTPDGKRIISGSDDKNIKCTDLESKQLIFSLLGHSSLIYSLAISIDGKILISGSKDKTVKLWNLENEELNTTLFGHTSDVFCVAITADNKYAVSGSGDTKIIVWNILARREEYTLREHVKSVKCLIISPNGKYLISGSEDATLKIWNLNERRIQYSIEEFSKYPRSVQVSSDNSFIVAGSTDSIRIWHMNQTRKNERKVSFASFYSEEQEWAPFKNFDFYIQEPLDFYNIIDFIKNKDYSMLLPTCSDVIFSKYCFTLTHIAAFYGNIEYLQKAFNQNFIIKCDIFGKSPFFYAIKRKHQDFVDLALNYLVDSKENYGAQFLTSTYALRNDFILIIKNSSKYLDKFLSSIIITCSKVRISAGVDIPLYQYSQAFLPILQDFTGISNMEKDSEIPVILKSTSIPFVAELNSKRSLELIQSIVECRNFEIYKTQFIQYFIELQWSGLTKWIVGYSSLIILSILLMLLLIEYSAKNLYILIPFIFVSSLLLIWEILQALSSGMKYLEDYMNIIDLLKSILIILWIILENFDEGCLYLTWMVMLLILIRGLTVFRYFDGLRYYFTLIVRALNDIKYFMLIFIYSTTTIGILYMISRGERLNFYTIWVTPYDLNFGNYDKVDHTEYVTEYIAFLGSTFINVVLMLNLLISILGDSFEQFQLEKVIIDVKEKSEIIFEIQQVVYWSFKESDLRYLHICDSPFEDNLNSNWEGKIVFLEKTIERNSRKTENQLNSFKEMFLEKMQTVETLERKVISLENNFNEKIDSLQTSLKKLIDFQETRLIS